MQSAPRIITDCPSVFLISFYAGNVVYPGLLS